MPRGRPHSEVDTEQALGITGEIILGKKNNQRKGSESRPGPSVFEEPQGGQCGQRRIDCRDKGRSREPAMRVQVS